MHCHSAAIQGLLTLIGKCMIHITLEYQYSSHAKYYLLLFTTIPLLHL